MVKLQIKKLSPRVQLPKYETSGSSGLDLCAFLDQEVVIEPNDKSLIPTGLSVEIPDGYEVQIRPRSGLAAKNYISVLNSPGTIDADYRGEIKILLFNHGKEKFKVTDGLRVAQMVLCPVEKAEIIETKSLNKTSRDKGGFGSTGLK